MLCFPSFPSACEDQLLCHYVSPTHDYHVLRQVCVRMPLLLLSLQSIGSWEIEPQNEQPLNSREIINWQPPQLRLQSTTRYLLRHPLLSILLRLVSLFTLQNVSLRKDLRRGNWNHSIRCLPDPLLLSLYSHCLLTLYSLSSLVTKITQ